MTHILFKDNKFWIDGIEMINRSIQDGDIFHLPEDLEYEDSGTYDMCRKVDFEKVIRLKLKDMKNDGKIMLGVPEYGEKEQGASDDYPVTEYAKNRMTGGSRRLITILQKQNEELKAWKKESIGVWMPVMEFIRNEGNLKVGDSISEEVLRRCREFSDLEAQLVKANITIKSIKDVIDNNSFGLTSVGKLHEIYKLSTKEVKE